MIAKEQKNLISEFEVLKRDFETVNKENIELKKINSADKGSDGEVEKLNAEVAYFKEQLELMDQTVQELKKEKSKQVAFNKKLLSEKNTLRYEQLSRVRQLEKLTHELENKNFQLMKSGQVNVIKK